MSAQCPPSVKKQHHVRKFWKMESRTENKYRCANVWIMHPCLELCSCYFPFKNGAEKEGKKILTVLNKLESWGQKTDSSWSKGVFKWTPEQKVQKKQRDMSLHKAHLGNYFPWDAMDLKLWCGFKKCFDKFMEIHIVHGIKQQCISLKKSMTFKLCGRVVGKYLQMLALVMDSSVVAGQCWGWDGTNTLGLPWNSQSCSDPLTYFAATAQINLQDSFPYQLWNDPLE